MYRANYDEIIGCFEVTSRQDVLLRYSEQRPGLRTRTVIDPTIPRQKSQTLSQIMSSDPTALSISVERPCDTVTQNFHNTKLMIRHIPPQPSKASIHTEILIASDISPAVSLVTARSSLTSPASLESTSAPAYYKSPTGLDWTEIMDDEDELLTPAYYVSSTGIDWAELDDIDEDEPSSTSITADMYHDAAACDSAHNTSSSALSRSVSSPSTANTFLLNRLQKRMQISDEQSSLIKSLNLFRISETLYFDEAAWESFNSRLHQLDITEGLDLATRKQNYRTCAEFGLDTTFGCFPKHASLRALIEEDESYWENKPCITDARVNESLNHGSGNLLPDLRSYIPQDTEADFQVTLEALPEAVHGTSARQEFARGLVDWHYMCEASKQLLASGQGCKSGLEPADRSVDWFWTVGNEARSAMVYDSGKAAPRKTTKAPASQGKSRQIHHLNFQGKTVYQKSATPPTTSYWLAMSEGLAERDDWNGSLRRTVLSYTAAEWVDPFAFTGDQHPTKLGGSLLQEAATGLVEKVYLPYGLWQKEQCGPDEDHPRDSEGQFCYYCNAPNVNKLPELPIHLIVEEVAVVNDDGRLHSPKPSRKRLPVGKRSNLSMEYSKSDDPDTRIEEIISQEIPLLCPLPFRPRLNSLMVQPDYAIESLAETSVDFAARSAHIEDSYTIPPDAWADLFTGNRAKVCFKKPDQRLITATEEQFRCNNESLPTLDQTVLDRKEMADQLLRRFSEVFEADDLISSESEPTSDAGEESLPSTILDHVEGRSECEETSFSHVVNDNTASIVVKTVPVVGPLERTGWMVQQPFTAIFTVSGLIRPSSPRISALQYVTEKEPEFIEEPAPQTQVLHKLLHMSDEERPIAHDTQVQLLQRAEDSLLSDYSCFEWEDEESSSDSLTDSEHKSSSSQSDIASDISSPKSSRPTTGQGISAKNVLKIDNTVTQAVFEAVLILNKNMAMSSEAAPEVRQSTIGRALPGPDPVSDEQDEDYDYRSEGEVEIQDVDFEDSWSSGSEAESDEEGQRHKSFGDSFINHDAITTIFSPTKIFVEPPIQPEKSSFYDCIIHPRTNEARQESEKEISVQQGRPFQKSSIAELISTQAQFSLTLPSEESLVEIKESNSSADGSATNTKKIAAIEGQADYIHIPQDDPEGKGEDTAITQDESEVVAISRAPTITGMSIQERDVAPLAFDCDVGFSLPVPSLSNCLLYGSIAGYLGYRLFTAFRR
ncbi:hypothetical protein MMC11_004988 [Xylographa trunciseda]|nr:hypothetical protein [Xylographa trunciseda]